MLTGSQKLIYGTAGLVLLGIVYAGLREVDQLALIRDGQRFYQALKAGNLEGTLVSTRIAVSVLWLISLAQFIKDQWLISLPVYTLTTAFVFWVRLIALLLTVWVLLAKLPKKFVLLLSMYWLLNVSIFAGNFTTWLDKLLSWFMLLSIVLYLYPERNEKLSGIPGSSLIYSGIALGLSVLTKPAGVFLVPMILVLEGKNILSCWRRLFTYFGVGYLTFFFLNPSMWVQPFKTMLVRTHTYSSDVAVSLGGDPGGAGTGFYLKQALKVDLTLWLGILVLLVSSRFLFTDNPVLRIPKRVRQAGLAGFVYLTCVWLVAHLLVDFDTGPGAFFSIRYLTPAVPLLSFPALYFLYQQRENSFAKLGLLILFIWAFIRLPLVHRYLRLVILPTWMGVM